MAVLLPFEVMSMATPRASHGNRLLDSLSSADLELLAPHLTMVVLRLRQVIEQPGKRITDLYFPDTGIVSVVALNPDGSRVEIGLIGREGVTGIAVLLGNLQSPHSTYIQMAGRGMRIPAVDLREAMDASASLQALLLKYVQIFMVQTAQTAVANARATLPQRLARWLLMAHDRSSLEKLPLTHEFLALMMGVRRAGVTEALQELARLKLTTAVRGEITILNRRGIEKIAGGYYGVPEAEYRRLVG
jgi:CRP-like cAMP-binding protein